MSVIAQAPGKLVILGEYAVLVGGIALVTTIDRYCLAKLRADETENCMLSVHTDTRFETRFAAGAESGVELVDLVTAQWPAAARRSWSATLDSHDLFGPVTKLGLGSSAAAMTAWAGAWCHFNGLARPALETLVGLHRRWRDGGGSGVDIAASFRGGVTTYRLSSQDMPQSGSAKLPDGVAFVAVSTGIPASTASLLRRFHEWRAAEPRPAGASLDRLSTLAGEGVDAAATDDAQRFVDAIAAYGDALDELGRAIGADIVTAKHRALAKIAARFGVAYKVSGAGGGDVGLAVAASPAGLEAFAEAVPPDCEVLKLQTDHRGLVVEEVEEELA